MWGPGVRFLISEKLCIVFPKNPLEEEVLKDHDSFKVNEKFAASWVLHHDVREISVIGGNKQ